MVAKTSAKLDGGSAAGTKINNNCPIRLYQHQIDKLKTMAERETLRVGFPVALAQMVRKLVAEGIERYGAGK